MPHCLILILQISWIHFGRFNGSFLAWNSSWVQLVLYHLMYLILELCSLQPRATRLEQFFLAVRIITQCKLNRLVNLLILQVIQRGAICQMVEAHQLSLLLCLLLPFFFLLNFGFVHFKI